jgi:hypothetical protein
VADANKPPTYRQTSLPRCVREASTAPINSRSHSPSSASCSVTSRSSFYVTLGTSPLASPIRTFSLYKTSTIRFWIRALQKFSFGIEITIVFCCRSIRRQTFGVYSRVGQRYKITLPAREKSWDWFESLDRQNCTRHDFCCGCAGYENARGYSRCR